MKTNRDGINLIKQYEGCRLKAYLDTGGIPTIGWGSTGSDITMGLEWTQKQADDRFEEDLYEFEKQVEKAIKVKLNSNQFSAIISFTYNLGIGKLQKSTLLKKLNAGDFKGASEQFELWVKDNGTTLPGLVKRRASEKALFLKPEVEYIKADILPDGPSEDEIKKILEGVEEGI